MMRQIYNKQMLYLSQHPKIEYIAEELDFKLIYLLFKMEKLGIKIDISEFIKMQKEMEQEYSELEKEIFSLAGREFNIGSPKQLSQVLFEEMNLPTTGIKKVKLPFWTKELDKIAWVKSVIELIEEVAKLKNTYVDTLPLLADKETPCTYNV